MIDGKEKNYWMVIVNPCRFCVCELFVNMLKTYFRVEKPLESWEEVVEKNKPSEK